MFAHDERWAGYMELASTYLKPVYPGEDMEASKARMAALVQPAPSEGGSAPTANLMIWTNLDEIWTPDFVHASFARALFAAVPDWHRENVRTYPITGGARVATPGGPIEEVLDGGYVVEQVGLGTTVDGAPYKCFVTHVMFVEDGRVARNHQYWSGPDHAANQINIQAMAETRGAWAATHPDAATLERY